MRRPSRPSFRCAPRRFGTAPRARASDARTSWPVRGPRTRRRARGTAPRSRCARPGGAAPGRRPGRRGSRPHSPPERCSVLLDTTAEQASQSSTSHVRAQRRRPARLRRRSRTTPTRGFLDTWTLLAYLAARTERIRLVPDVLNLPLRLPSVVAKSAALLDLLSDGRVELGIGAGAFWDAVAAFGGPRRTPTSRRRARGGDRDPARMLVRRALRDRGGRALPRGRREARSATSAPDRPLDRRLRPRMLRLTGRLADGWLPSLGRLDADEIAAMHARSTRPPSEPGATPARSSGSRTHPRSKASRTRGPTSCAGHGARLRDADRPVPRTTRSASSDASART